MLIEDNEKIVVSEVEVEITGAVHHHVIVLIEIEEIDHSNVEEIDQMIVEEIDQMIVEEIDQMIEENLEIVEEELILFIFNNF
jgi:hypothetical protein